MQRMPFRPVRMADQAHVRFAGHFVSLPHIARQTGTDDVFPRRLPAPRDRHDMIERQLGRRVLAAAVLTTIAVAQIDVPARELHFLARQAIEDQKLDHVGDQNVAARRADIVVVRLNRNVHPVLEVIRPVLGVDCANVSLVEQGKGAADGRDLHRLKDPVKDEHVAIEHNRSPVTHSAMPLVSVADRFLREGRYIIHGRPLLGTGSRPHRTADGASG